LPGFVLTLRILPGLSASLRGERGFSRADIDNLLCQAYDMPGLALRADECQYTG